MKTLGEAAPDVDDLGAWVTKSRALEEARKAEERAKAEKAARMLALQVRFLLLECAYKSRFSSLQKG